MMTKYFAHSALMQDKSDWQPLADHLLEVGRRAAENARYFESGDIARLAGLLHDVGKYTAAFQRRLDGDLSRVDHSTRGAIEARDRYGKLGILLAYAIAGHHAGLANGRNGELRSSLADRLKRELPVLDPVWSEEIELTSHPRPPKIQPVASRPYFQFTFLGRMLFSALVDADYLDTEAFYAGLKFKESPRDRAFPKLEELRDRLDQYLSGFKEDKAVNKVRAEILGHVRNQAHEAPGLFSLNVPTGGGKTLTSLAFALDHAIKHKLRRVIFVIPFTSIVEQNAAVFRTALGDLGEQAVLEHHSAFVDPGSQAPQAREKLSRAMENWDAPVVVTTAVQFFESLYADRPSRCRKLHNITGSVVILDEIQTLPLKLLRPCIAAIDELARNYTTSLILCTATQPAFREEDGFAGGLVGVRELAPDPQALHKRLKRASFHHAGPLTDQQLADELAARKQVLCIVNNRRHARALFESIKHEAGARHLTTLMCAKHRSLVLGEIRADLQAGVPCRLVSTSLIEAGVDVDFPTVFRAEAGLDSVAQAAGRCNRESRFEAEESKVFVFSVADDWPAPPELAQFAQAARLAFRRFGDSSLSLAAIRYYFSELYWQKGPHEMDTHDLLQRIEDGQLEGIPYETLASRFQMIESSMQPVIIPFDKEAEQALLALEAAEYCGQLARRLQPYIVQIPERSYLALKKAGAVAPVQQERFAEQFVCLLNTDLYDREHGLNWDDPVFLSAERLVP